MKEIPIILLLPFVPNSLRASYCVCVSRTIASIITARYRAHWCHAACPSYQRCEYSKSFQIFVSSTLLFYSNPYVKSYIHILISQICMEIIVAILLGKSFPSHFVHELAKTWFFHSFSRLIIFVISFCIPCAFPFFPESYYILCLSFLYSFH